MTGSAYAQCRLKHSIGEEDAYSGIVDVVRMKAIKFVGEGGATQMEEIPIPAELMDEAKQANHDCMAAAAECDEALMEKYIMEEPLTTEEILWAFVRARCRTTIVWWSAARRCAIRAYACCSMRRSIIFLR